MIAIILIGFFFLIIGGFALFVIATITGTLVGIIGGIVQGTRNRRAAAAAGAPYPKLTYKEAKAARLARLNATIQQVPALRTPGPLHQSARPKQAAAGMEAENITPMTPDELKANGYPRDFHERARQSVRPGYWTSVPDKPTHTPGHDTQA